MEQARTPGRFWQRVGWARCEGLACRAYQAPAAVPCALCGRQIPPGEHFTRHTANGPGTPLAPFCKHCRPFVELGW